MIPRILEPEVMDTPEEANDYDSMDHSEVNRLFVFDFLQIWNGRSLILDVGTGTAQIPLEFCRQSAEGKIVGIDLAEQMLRIGRNHVQKAGLEHRIQLEKVNARKMPYPNGSFEAIMSNSIIHHIPEPKSCFAEIVRVAATGATIFVRDLLRPDSAEQLLKLVQLHAKDANAHQQKMFTQSLHAALTLDEVRKVIGSFGFDPLQVTQTSNRHWTWAVPGTKSKSIH